MLICLARPAAGSYQPPAVASASTSPRAFSPSYQQQQQQQPASAGGVPGPWATPDPQHRAAAQQQEQQQAAAESGAFLSPIGSDGYRTGPNTPRSVDGLLPGVLEEGEGEAGPHSKGLAPGWQAGQAGFRGAAQQQQYQLSAEAEGGPGSSGDVWQQLQWQVTLGNSEEWADAGPVRQLFRKVGSARHCHSCVIASRGAVAYCRS